MGNVEDNENIHQSKYSANHAEFLQLMMIAIRDTRR